MPDVSDPLGPEIVDDEPCPRCGYNLRGLREGGRCPECGRNIPLNFDFDELDEAEVESLRLTELQPIADAVGRSVAAVDFVQRAFTIVNARAIRAGRRGRRFTAQEFAWGVRDLAIQHFHDADAARMKFAQWGLVRSEDVGAIAAALVGAQLVFNHGGITGADEFAGLFTVDSLFER